MFDPTPKTNQVAVGTMLTVVAPHWIAPLAQAGLDAVFIDTEHHAIDRCELAMMCRAFSQAGVTPLVRIPTLQPHLACMALDDGAEGIIAPYVESPEQVRELVGATKLRPLKGAKLHQHLVGQTEIEPDLQSYIDNRCKSNRLLIQIESLPAVESIDELLIDGVDGVLFGPHDLSCNLGLPERYAEAEVQDAIFKVAKSCQSHNKWCGLPWWPDLGSLSNYLAMGVNLIFYQSDTGLLQAGISEGVSQIKEFNS